MAKKIKITRKELLKEPDHFLSSTDKAISFFTQNRLAVMGSFIAVFIILFVLIKLAGSILSKFFSVIGLNFIDKGLGFLFGATKGTAILVTIFILSSGFLENQSWWNESLSKEWTTRIAEVMEPLIKDWKTQAEILLNKENVTFPPTL